MVLMRATQERRSLAVFWVLLVAAALVPVRLGPAVSAWLTVFVAICVQAGPYVVLGVLVAVVLRVVPGRVFGALRALPPSLAVPVFALGGAALPGCECGSVTLAGGLLRRGVPPGPAVALMLSAPAVNPVVVVATVTAFPGRPAMVVARVSASVAVAVLVGWWAARSRFAPERIAQHDHDAPAAAQLARALALLVVGAALTATASVCVPSDWLDVLGASPVFGVAVLAVAAVLMSVCSTADAFVAASFTRFSATAQVTFMVVGAVLDAKSIPMYAGTFGRRVASRLVPLLGLVATGCAVTVALALGLSP